MDTELLVKEGQALVRHLDQGQVKPRSALWVYDSERDDWRLWIVPPSNMTDRFELYRLVAETLSAHRADMPTLDIGSIEFKTEDHPAIKGLGRIVHMEGIGAAPVRQNMLNGFYLSDSVVLRMAV